MAASLLQAETSCPALTFCLQPEDGRSPVTMNSSCDYSGTRGFPDWAGPPTGGQPAPLVAPERLAEIDVIFIGERTGSGANCATDGAKLILRLGIDGRGSLIRAGMPAYKIESGAIGDPLLRRDQQVNLLLISAK